jgi:hypothetical protein
MAAPDLSVSRVGQVNGAGDPLALFLKVFANEVLAAFQTANVALARTQVRTIPSGKSASFPATWKGTASYHTPGTMLVGSQIKANERIITIDDLLVADRAIAQIDEAMNHYDVRSIYSTDIGYSLSNTMDRNILQVGLLAARASATVTGGNGGSSVVDASLATAANLEAFAFTAAQKLDEKDVPDADRSIFLKPQEYYTLVKSTKAFNRDWNPDGNGGFGIGKIMQIAGLEIVKTNQLPQSNVTTGPTAYQGNFSTTLALVMNRSAVGTVKLLDLSLESQWLIQNQSTLMVGKYACGHGILRPECAVEGKTS